MSKKLFILFWLSIVAIAATVTIKTTACQTKAGTLDGGSN